MKQVCPLYRVQFRSHKSRGRGGGTAGQKSGRAEFCEKRETAGTADFLRTCEACGENRTRRQSRKEKSEKRERKQEQYGSF